MSLSAEQFQPLQTALPGMLGGGGQGAQHVAGAASAVGPMGHCNLGIDKTMRLKRFNDWMKGAQARIDFMGLNTDVQKISLLRSWAGPELLTYWEREVGARFMAIPRVAVGDVAAMPAQAPHTYTELLNLTRLEILKHVNRDRSLIDLLHMRQSSESWMTFVHDLEGAADLCQLETKPVTRDDLIRVLALAGMKDRNLAEKALAEQYTLKTLISTGSTRETSKATADALQGKGATGGSSVSRLARHGRRLSGDGKYFYDVLELDKGATDKDIKNAYRSLSRKYHPDKNVDSEDSEENAARMAELGKANAILSDPEQKAVYDKWGSKGIVAGQSLGGLERVNRVTMFICKISGGLPEFV